MSDWNPNTGFSGTLAELLESLWQFYPSVESVVKIQSWLLERAASTSEVLVCRNHAGRLRGEFYSAPGENGFFTSDNEFATSIFGLALGKDTSQLTSGSVTDSFGIRGVRLCWALGATRDERDAVTASHARQNIAAPPTGGTSLYPHRGSKQLKLAHLASAADELSSLPHSDAEQTKLRFIRSVNPLNMYPMPCAGKAFRHSASKAGQMLNLHRNELGETQVIIDCILAFLEEKYRQRGFEEAFDLYVQTSKIKSMDFLALRSCSQNIEVKVEKAERVAESKDALTYEAFKAWAQQIVSKYGNAAGADRFANGGPCEGSDGSPVVCFTMDRFDADSDSGKDAYNCAYRVAGDTRVSALAYFLLLDERCASDQNAIFRPSFSRGGGSRKPLLNFVREDVESGVIPFLALYSGEIKGWNVLSVDKVRD